MASWDASSASRPRAGGPLRQATLLAALAALVLTACGGSEFTYVSNSTFRTYFKVPNSWRVFDTEEVLEGRTNPQKDEAYDYLRIFDAAPDPSVDRTFQTAAHPYGLVQIRRLTSVERDVFSLRRLRNEVVNLDEIAEESPERIDLLETPVDIVMGGGISGVRHVYTITDDTGSWSVSQTALVNPFTTRVYFFAIGCEAGCYAANQAMIEEVVDSWTIEES